MIEKFRKIQNSWAIKAVLVLTILSFMSLFGVSGYVNSAGANKTIAEVGGTKIGLNEVYALFNRDTQVAQSMLGQNLNLTPEMKNSILVGIVNQETASLIVEKTAKRAGVDLSQELLRGFIQSQQQFFGEDNKFNFNLFQRFLAMTYQSEESYVNNIAKDIKKQILISQAVENVKFPKAYDKYLSQAAGIKKNIEYIAITPSDISVDRKITDEELEQYYVDFASEFMAPETRDVSYIYVASKDDYDANVELLEEIEDTIGAGSTLADVAKKYGTQIKAAKKVSQESQNFESDMLDSIFSYNEGEISNVIETEGKGFAVVEVTKIYPEYQKDMTEVKSDIIKLWQEDEKLAIAQEISTDVANDVADGDSLSSIAKRFGLNLKTINALSKGESFASLSQSQAQEAFNEPKGSVKIFSTNDGKILSVVKSVIKDNKADKTLLNAYKTQLATESQENLTNAYGKELGVKMYLNRL